MNQSLAHSISCFLGALQHLHALAWPAQKPRKQHRPTAGWPRICLTYGDIRIICEQPPNTWQLSGMATEKSFNKRGMTTFGEGPLQGPQLQPQPSTDGNSMRECASNPCFMSNDPNAKLIAYMECLIVRFRPTAAHAGGPWSRRCWHSQPKGCQAWKTSK